MTGKTGSLLYRGGTLEATPVAMHIGLPIVWLVALGWAGHRLNADGAIGHVSNGIGRAAVGGIRLGGKLLKTAVKGK